MRMSKLKIAGLLCLLLLSVVSAQEKEKKEKPEKNGEKRVSLKSLPTAVQQTAHEHSQGAVIRGVSKEVEDGKTFYEVALKVNGRTKDITIAPDGTLVTAEEEVTLASLPTEARATIEKNLGKGRLLLVESVTEEGQLAFYEAHVQTGRKKSEIKVTTDGQLVPEGKKK